MTSGVPSNALATLAKVETEIADMFLEREDVIRMAFLALFAKQHAILIGPPGTGKSALIRELCMRFCDPQGNGLRYFFYQLHKLTQLDEIVGPVSFEGMEDGTYKRVTEGTFATADVVFFDEIWKTSSAIHNATLRGTNERKFKNGILDEDIPLNTVFGASNELPEGQELAAARDRYLFTAFVGYLSPDGFKRFIERKTGLQADPFKAPKTVLSKADFVALQEYGQTIPFTKSVVSTFCTIREELGQNKIFISDRREEWCLSVMRANAMMEQRDEVNEDDLAALIPALWMEPNQLKTVTAIINKHSNPTNAKASQLKDDAQTVYEQATEGMRQNQNNRPQRLIIASEAAAKLEATMQELQALQAGQKKAGKTNKRVDQALAQVTKQHQEMLASVGFKSTTR